MNTRFPAILFLLLIFSQLDAQNKGLLKPQDQPSLPKSRAAIVFPVQHTFVPATPTLDKCGNNEWIVSGGWELAPAKQIVSDGEVISTGRSSPGKWMNATVPGTILTTLVNNGVYPDPLFGLNNLMIPDTLCRTDWWYRTGLPLPGDYSGKKILILFNGINYRAEVWFNGTLLGKISGAFIRGEFDLTPFLKQSGNILAVHIFPPDHPGIPHEQNLASPGPNGGLMCYDGPTFVCTEGWDWVPGIRDRNTGIWQDVRLRIISDAEIIDPQVITDLPLPDTSMAMITVRTGISNHGSREKNFVITGEIGKTTFSKKVRIGAGRSEKIAFTPANFPQLNLQSPGLWWPNGYGRQNLYTLKLTVTDENGTVSDTRDTRFGIREMSYDFTVDYQSSRQDVRVNLNPLKVWEKTEKILTYRMHGYESRRLPGGIQVGFVPVLSDTVLLDRGAVPSASPYLVILVNGRPVYCRGGNWGLDEAMKRVSREKLEPYFRLHRDAGFTMIRNWVGQSTEEVFYDLADEYGMLIWNDFWMSTENYNLDPWDNQLFMNNARDAIRRFRNHPSIALWCGRNEGNPPMALDDSLHILQAREDGTRIFHSSSIKNNLANSGPWYYGNFVKKEIHNKEGFNTETGAPAVPVAETMRTMMAPEDLWPVGDAWYYHDLHRGQLDYIDAIKTRYGAFSTPEELCKKAQMLNYDMYREIFEAWNYRLWNTCSGLLLWMSHPAWPSTVWQTYSYDYETNGVFYGSRKACEPLHIQFEPGTSRIYFINNTFKNYPGMKAELKLYDLAGKVLHSQNSVCDAGSNCRVRCFEASMPAGLPSLFFARLSAYSSDGRMLSENTYIMNPGAEKSFIALNETGNAKIRGRMISAKISGNIDSFDIELSNPGVVAAVALKLNLRNAKSGERILPAYISDGYFTLLPGERRIIKVECPSGKSVREMKITAEGYNVSLQDVTELKLNKR